MDRNHIRLDQIDRQIDVTRALLLTTRLLLFLLLLCYYIHIGPPNRRTTVRRILKRIPGQ